MNDPNRRDFDVAVLGLGGIGSGAAYWLARRFGRGVLGIEQFELGHVRGGSQDHSRIIRYSYHAPHYVALAELTYRAWGEVESESGDCLVHRVGGLDLFPEGGSIPLSDYTRSLDDRGVPYELLSGTDILDRWPQLAGMESVTGLFQADGGLVDAARANGAHQRLAREHGATLLERTPVRALAEEGGEVVIDTGERRYRCGALVIAAGAWAQPLLAGIGLRLPLEVTQEQVTYFRSRDLEAFARERFPVWIWMDDPCFYGFPVYGEPAVKVGQDVGGAVVTADTRTFEPDQGALARTVAFMERYMPGAVGPPLLTKTCLYTLTPDRDFVVDRLPGWRHASLVVGAGHAFKFASVLGQLAGELAVDGRTDFDLAPFRVDRPILHEENPARSYMV